MVLFNYSTKELTAKVVYYGPGLCGKTTNLQWIHEKLPIKNKGKMLSLATETDRTLFFDFLPIEIGTIRGMQHAHPALHRARPGLLQRDPPHGAEGRRRRRVRVRLAGGDARRQPRELREHAAEPRGERDRPRRDPDRAAVQQARPAERAADRDPERADEPAQRALLRGGRGEGRRRRGHAQGASPSSCSRLSRRSTATAGRRCRVAARPRSGAAAHRPAAAGPPRPRRRRSRPTNCSPTSSWAGPAR